MRSFSAAFGFSSSKVWLCVPSVRVVMTMEECLAPSKARLLVGDDKLSKVDQSRFSTVCKIRFHPCLWLAFASRFCWRSILDV